MGIQPFTNSKNKNVQNWVIICYGNILRSQVLEQYLRYYSKQWDLTIEFYSAGISESDEFPNTKKLLTEIYKELQSRNIPCSLQRNAWNKDVETEIISSVLVICADNKVKSTILERMHLRINREKVFTFYEAISEGDIDFEDTYDYEKKRQDPDRFHTAFNELDRIAQKILNIYRS
ncbi:MAG: hypothetical protein KAG94_01975 [Clostridiales bacterium]|nr:hypothetical protein [Clostridiales bacterium]